MATPDSAFERLMARATDDLPSPTWSDPADLSRMSIAVMASRDATAVDHIGSTGEIRLHGSGVEGHAASLDLVGQVASRWQRAVSAVGAAIENVRSTSGRFPDIIAHRTALLLSASPGPGSIVLSISPRTDTQPTLSDVHRTLADEASETLLRLLAAAAGPVPKATALAAELKQLGPRTAGSVRLLAAALDQAHFDMDAVWREPGSQPVAVSLSAGGAGWLKDFVKGQELDVSETEMAGIVHTVSDVAKWLVDVSGEQRLIDASRLAPTVIRAVHIGQSVRLKVRVNAVERPDGTMVETLTAMELLSQSASGA